jgi:hypothetical protein
LLRSGYPSQLWLAGRGGNRLKRLHAGSNIWAMKKSSPSASKKAAPAVVAVKKAVQKPTHVTRAEIRRAVKEVAAARMAAHG